MSASATPETDGATPPSDPAGPSSSGGVVKASILAVLASLVTAFLVGGAGYAISTYGFGVQAFGVFTYTPFVMGLTSAFVHRRVAPRGPLPLALLLATGTPLLGLSLLLTVGIEGIVCIIFAAPLMIAASLPGAAIGVGMAHALPRGGPITMSLLLGLILVPAVEAAILPPAEPREVRTELVVNAPPDAVWARVVRFPPIDGPADGWQFALGVPSPAYAELDVDEVGGLRRCVFTEGVFDERVSVWEPGRNLTFDVERQPVASEPYVHARILRGRFLLEPLDDGRRTRIIGSTWYEHDLRPKLYWDACADDLLHRVHLAVLEHVRVLAEADAAPDDPR